ncbi:MAG: 23S rRNA (pseudouridine(1915)-N(3))-methyltransferase RlmH [Fibromonadaceae bacterium]|jgi:23S rRNA (pseudouridine1915-N3)-methyltransferase|nr:23S rRNA (pseudouridine(1915)-N(3))-methyltransferase RlmH [Fibromonadaceae bacterium]
MKIYLANFDKLSKNINEELLKYTKRLGGLVEIATLKNIAAFEKKFPADKFTRIVLSEEGNLLSTRKLSEWINARLSKNMVFLVGAAYGIESQTKQSADLLLSLSPLTFSHEHAFLILTEQVYRSLMLIKGHPYHHE